MHAEHLCKIVGSDLLAPVPAIDQGLVEWAIATQDVHLRPLRKDVPTSLPGVKKDEAVGASQVVPSSSPERITISGGAHEEFMDTYTESDVNPTQSHDRRPLYQNSKGKWLYYWKDTKYWLLGSRHDDGGGIYYSPSVVTSPLAATDWNEYNFSSSSWSPVQLSVTEVQKVAPGVGEEDHARSPGKHQTKKAPEATGSGEADEHRHAESLANVRAQAKKAAEAADQAAGMLPAARRLAAEERLLTEALITAEEQSVNRMHRSVAESETQAELEVAAQCAAARAHAWATAAKQTISSAERAELELEEAVMRSNAVIGANGPTSVDAATEAIADVKQKVEAVLSCENLLKSQARGLSGSTAEADRARVAVLANGGSCVDVSAPVDSKMEATPFEMLATMEKLRLAEVEGVMAELEAQKGIKDEECRRAAMGSSAENDWKLEAETLLLAERKRSSAMLEALGAIAKERLNRGGSRDVLEFSTEQSLPVSVDMPVQTVLLEVEAPYAPGQVGQVETVNVVDVEVTSLPTQEFIMPMVVTAADDDIVEPRLRSAYQSLCAASDGFKDSMQQQPVSSSLLRELSEPQLRKSNSRTESLCTVQSECTLYRPIVTSLSPEATDMYRPRIVVTAPEAVERLHSQPLSSSALHAKLENPSMVERFASSASMASPLLSYTGCGAGSLQTSPPSNVNFESPPNISRVATVRPTSPSVIRRAVPVIQAPQVRSAFLLGESAATSSRCSPGSLSPSGRSAGLSLSDPNLFSVRRTNGVDVSSPLLQKNSMHANMSQTRTIVQSSQSGITSPSYAYFQMPPSGDLYLQSKPQSDITSPKTAVRLSPSSGDIYVQSTQSGMTSPSVTRGQLTSSSDLYDLYLQSPQSGAASPSITAPQMSQPSVVRARSPIVTRVPSQRALSPFPSSAVVC
jgi:hypothetical protein